MKKITKYVFADIARNKIVLAYTGLLLIISFSVFSIEDNSAKGMLSLLNLVLILVPLVSIIFSTIYIYNSAEFIELLVSQPLRRKQIWASLFAGLAGSLSFAFLIGVGLPVLIMAPSQTGLVMTLIGWILTIIFVGIAMLAAVYTRDKAKGIGVAIFLWLFFSLIFDGLILLLLFQFQDYPLEKFMIAATALNPIDLSRIIILLQMDISALMGMTGALFRDFFGSTGGILLAGVVLILWATGSFWLSLRRFSRKDL